MSRRNSGNDSDLAQEISKLEGSVSSLQHSVNDMEERALYELIDKIDDLSMSVGSKGGDMQSQLKEINDNLEALFHSQERTAQAQERMADALENISQQMQDE